MKLERLASRSIVSAVLAMGTAVASASVPAADGTYTGCYFKSLGTIRLIDTAIPAQKCLAGLETVVTWNRTGPQGPAGPAGVPGATGAPGAKGANGTNVTASSIDPISDSRCGFLGGVEVFQDGVSKAVVCSIQGPAGVLLELLARRERRATRVHRGRRVTRERRERLAPLGRPASAPRSESSRRGRIARMAAQRSPTGVATLCSLVMEGHR
jgi:hypothetical protein